MHDVVVTALADPTPAVESLFAKTLRATSIGAVALISLMAFESLAVTTAMPTVARELDGLALYSLAFSASMAASVVGMVAAGSLSDARGPTVPLLRGVAWFIAGLLVSGLAPAMWVMVAGRLLQGCGAGLASVALYVVVARIYPQELHPRVFAAFAAAWVVPSIVGPTIAGVVVAHAGWRWVFLGVPLLALLATALLWPALAGLREREEGTARATAGSAPDRRLWWAIGAAGSAVGLQAAARAEALVAIPLVVLLLALLAVCALRLLPAGTLRGAHGLPAVVLLRGLAAGAFFATEVYLPLLLVREHGLTPAVAGLVLTVGALGWSAGSWWQGRHSSAATRAGIVRAGMALLLAGIAGQALLLLLDAPAAASVVAWGVTGVGIGLAYPTFAVLVLELSPVAQQGESTAALQLSESLLAATMLALGGIVFSALLDAGAHVAYLAAFGFAASWALVGLLVAGRVRVRAPRYAGR